MVNRPSSSSVASGVLEDARPVRAAANRPRPIWDSERKLGPARGMVLGVILGLALWGIILAVAFH